VALSNDVTQKGLLCFRSVTLLAVSYGLFNNGVSSSDYIESNDRMINWKGYGRKWSWPYLRPHPGICLEGLGK
jgi:hypothetical protein